MKHLGLLLLGLVGLSLAWVAWRADSPAYSAPAATPEPPAEVPSELSGVVPAGSVVRTFDIEGICCAGCPGQLFVKLDQLDGVEEAAVDAVSKRASVVLPADFDVARVEEALTFSKYSATLAD
jgi:hypothetical protein